MNYYQPLDIKASSWIFVRRGHRWFGPFSILSWRGRLFVISLICRRLLIIIGLRRIVAIRLRNGRFITISRSSLLNLRIFGFCLSPGWCLSFLSCPIHSCCGRFGSCHHHLLNHRHSYLISRSLCKLNKRKVKIITNQLSNNIYINKLLVNFDLSFFNYLKIE